MAKYTGPAGAGPTPKTQDVSGAKGKPAPKKPGSKPQQAENAARQDAKDLKNWIDRQTQRAKQGQGLLQGIDGGTQLVDRLRNDPALAARVQAYIKNLPPKKEMPGVRGLAGQDELLAAFPELYQQYIGAQGQAIIYDAEGNPVRTVDPNETYGMREGDQVVTPDFYGPNGEQAPLPTPQAPTETENQFLAARAARLQAETATGDQAPFFSLEDLQGGED